MSFNQFVSNLILLGFKLYADDFADEIITIAEAFTRATTDGNYIRFDHETTEYSFCFNYRFNPATHTYCLLNLESEYYNKKRLARSWEFLNVSKGYTSYQDILKHVSARLKECEKTNG